MQFKPQRKTIFIFGIGIPVNNKLNYAFWDISNYAFGWTSEKRFIVRLHRMHSFQMHKFQWLDS